MPRTKKDLQLLLKDPEAKWFFYNLYGGESHIQDGILNYGGHNQTAGDSTAFGSGQFIGKTRDAILEKYGVDAWSDDLDEQKMAALALLEDNGELENVLVHGRYEGLNTTRMWEAFTGESSDGQMTKAEEIFGRTKPEGWEGDLSSMESNAVFDPKSSWDAMDPEMQKQKAGWFESKYGINDPSNPTSITGGEWDELGEDKTPKPTNQAQSQPKKTELELQMEAARKSFNKVEHYQSLSSASRELSEEEKEAARIKIVEASREFHSKYKDTNWADDDKTRVEYLNSIKTALGIDSLDVDNIEDLATARAKVDLFISMTDNKEFSERISGKDKSWGNWDTVFDDLIEDTRYRDDIIYSELNIPEKGQASQAAKEVIYNDPSLQGYVTRDVTADGEGQYDVRISDDYLETHKLAKQKIIDANPALYEEQTLTGESATDLINRAKREKQKAPTITPIGVKSISIDSGEDKPLELIDDRAERQKEHEGLEKTPLTDEQKAARNKKWMQAGQAGLGILKAAAGIKSLSKALQEHKVDVPELSPLLTEAVNKQRELSKAGFTAEEKASAMTNINNAYASAMKNVLRASGGQRGAFLANQGVVDANRVGALVDLAAKDAAVRRQNIQGFNQLASSVGQMQLNRDMTVEQMKQQTVNQNRQLLSGIGTNLLSGALDEASYYLNPNRKAMDEMTSNILQSLGGSNSGYDPAASSQANITAASQQNAEE